MERLTYSVPGMRCFACAGAIRAALGSEGGIRNIEVDHQRKRIRIEYDPRRVDPRLVCQRLQAAGFLARSDLLELLPDCEGTNA